jgi:hypothetical protein
VTTKGQRTPPLLASETLDSRRHPFGAPTSDLTAHELGATEGSGRTRASVSKDLLELSLALSELNPANFTISSNPIS